MSYRQLFDHLGNPVARPSRQPLGHRIIQRVCVASIVVMVLYLYGVRA